MGARPGVPRLGGVPGTRTELARGLFAPLGPTYDRYANALSFGQDPRWRRFLLSRPPVAAAAAGALPVGRPPGGRPFLVSRLPVDADDVVLDVATGTAAVALELVRQTGCSGVGGGQRPGVVGQARRRQPAAVR